MNANRDEFSTKTKDIVAKRAGLLCYICETLTIGSSLESFVSTTNMGVAAHITAASLDGPRYDNKISSQERLSISNGIWFCQNQATLIDRDIISWPKERIIDVKTTHEKLLRDKIGIPSITSNSKNSINSEEQNSITPREYGFLSVSSLLPSYYQLINPILLDKNLSEESILGVIMCGASMEERGKQNHITPWTIFVNAE